MVVSWWRCALRPVVVLLCVVVGASCTAGPPSPRPGKPEASKPSRVEDADQSQAAVRYGWGPVVAGDEFDYVGAPASSKWRVYDSVGHAGEGRRAPSAWIVDGSMATVVGNSSGTTGGMSARFGSRLYGRWETRMRTSVRDPKYHPVLLLWPEEPVAASCREIDYSEGTERLDSVKFFLHYGCGSRQTRASRLVDGTQWHNYAVEWTPTSVTGFIDGVRFFHDATASHIPRTPMHQTVQLDWFPDGTATKPSAMMVDWVRVYAGS